MSNPPIIVQYLSQALGESWYLLEPETILMKLGDISVAEENLIEAVRIIYTSKLPWEDPFVFENIVDALNENPVNPDVVTKPDIDEIMYAVACMKEINSANQFSDDVLAFIAATAMYDGFVWLPDILMSAQKFMKPHELQLGFTGGNVDKEAFDIQKKKILDANASYLIKLGKSL